MQARHLGLAGRVGRRMLFSRRDWRSILRLIQGRIDLSLLLLDRRESLLQQSDNFLLFGQRAERERDLSKLECT